MSPILFYVFTLAVYAVINAMQALGFNLQFGYGGVINLAFIVSVAIGAYGTLVAGIPPAPHQIGVETYIGGFSWAFPWDMLFGILMALVFSAILGVLVFYRLHGDYLAVTMIILASGLLVLVNNDTSLLNGVNGLAGVQPPWASFLNPQGGSFQVAFLCFCLFLLAVTWILVARMTRGPFGRTLKAVREDEAAAASLGANPVRYKMWAFIVGGAIGGMSGALLAVYDGAWNVSAWQLGETLVLLAAVIVGGRGRHSGAVLGSLLLMTGIVQGTKYLPSSWFNASVLASIQTILVGVIVLAFLWLRPQGLLPEKLETVGSKRASGRAVPGWRTPNVKKEPSPVTVTVAAR